MDKIFVRFRQGGEILISVRIDYRGAFIPAFQSNPDIDAINSNIACLDFIFAKELPAWMERTFPIIAIIGVSHDNLIGLIRAFVTMDGRFHWKTNIFLIHLRISSSVL